MVILYPTLYILFFSINDTSIFEIYLGFFFNIPNLPNKSDKKTVKKF